MARRRLRPSELRARRERRAAALLWLLPVGLAILAGLLAYGATGATTREAEVFLTDAAFASGFLAVISGGFLAILSGLES